MLTLIIKENAKGPSEGSENQGAFFPPLKSLNFTDSPLVGLQAQVKDPLGMRKRKERRKGN